MKLVALETIDFPSIGRVVHKGEFEATKEESKIFLTSPFIIKQEKDDPSKKVSLDRKRTFNKGSQA